MKAMGRLAEAVAIAGILGMVVLFVVVWMCFSLLRLGYAGVRGFVVDPDRFEQEAELNRIFAQA